MKQVYLTPGPSGLYFTVEEHIKKALREQIPSISHRSGRFQEVYAEATGNLRKLLSLPDNFQILFTASATEVWERLIQNCVEQQSAHLVNGSFSARFREISELLGREALGFEAPYGTCVKPGEVIAPQAELISVTHNETSTGAMQPLEDIAALRQAYPEALIAVDGVSSLPYVQLDWSLIDSAYFSVQKCFGLPAGLGVWLVNERCIAKAEAIQAKGLSIGSYHTLPAMLEKAAKYQNAETPNVLGIYLLGKVAGDMLEKGIDMIRRETEYKAALLYNTLEQHPQLSAFVKEERLRSRTVVVGEVAGGSTALIDYLKGKGMVTGSGYGSYKLSHVRIANFPTTSKEQVEMLADFITAFGV